MLDQNDKVPQNRNGKARERIKRKNPRRNAGISHSGGDPIQDAIVLLGTIVIITYLRFLVNTFLEIILKFFSRRQ